MSFNTMSFKDLQDIHSLQIYNDNPNVGKEDQFADAYDMMANIMEFKKDLKKWFSETKTIHNDKLDKFIERLK